MTLLLISLLAGALSVLAPCIIATLPILLTRASSGNRKKSPLLIIASLLTSIFLFSLLLKASTLLIAVPTRTWQIISGCIIILFGLVSVFPSLWEKFSGSLKLQIRAQKKSGAALQATGPLGDILLGASLGPVFSACSPTYALIIASILPVSPLQGIVYLLVFLSGLGIVLFIITQAGSTAVKRLGWGINPHGWFKRTLGLVFILLGLLLATGIDKKIQASFVQAGWFDWQIQLESQLQQE